MKQVLIIAHISLPSTVLSVKMSLSIAKEKKDYKTDQFVKQTQANKSQMNWKNLKATSKVKTEKSKAKRMKS